MKQKLVLIFCLAAFVSTKAQNTASPVTKTLNTKSVAEKQKGNAPKKADAVQILPRKIIPVLNIDKYLSLENEEIAIRELDSLYPNTTISRIENIDNFLYNRKFRLISHLIEQFELTPNMDFLHNLNKYDFVCGVGLKRTKDVSPACMQPRVYEHRIDSDRKVNLAKLIIRKGVKPDFNAVNRCIGKNEVELFKLLYENMNSGNKAIEGEKFLVDACDNGSYDIVTYLLEQNVSANAYDHLVEEQGFKFYALYRAVKYPEIFTLLVQKGADIKIQGYANTTPVIHAAREGCIEVLQYLLEQGIDPYQKQGNMSAFDMANKFNKKNKKEVIALFKKAKAK